jgi:ribonuclease III
MDNKRQYNNGQHGRQDDSYHKSKKPRLDNHYSHSQRHPSHSHKSHSTQPESPHIQSFQQSSKSILPTPLPPLPTISDAYAKPTFTHPNLAPGEYTSKTPNKATTTTSTPTTHPDPSTMQSYDRLEFLGDAYLEVIATRLIWTRFASAMAPGRLASTRESLVKNETLAAFAVAYGFDRRMRIEEGGQPTTRLAQVKLWGDVFEAFVASVVLSGGGGGEESSTVDHHQQQQQQQDQPQPQPRKSGFEIAEDWLALLWEPLLVAAAEKDRNALPGAQWKEGLRKMIGAKGVRIDYVDERKPLIGKGIETYFVGVFLTGWGYENQHLGSGQALSKKAAGMAAAKDAVENSSVVKKVANLKEEKQKDGKDAPTQEP